VLWVLPLGTVSWVFSPCISGSGQQSQVLMEVPQVMEFHPNWTGPQLLCKFPAFYGTQRYSQQPPNSPYPQPEKFNPWPLFPSGFPPSTLPLHMCHKPWPSKPSWFDHSNLLSKNHEAPPYAIFSGPQLFQYLNVNHYDYIPMNQFYIRVILYEYKGTPVFQQGIESCSCLTTLNDLKTATRISWV